MTLCRQDLGFISMSPKDKTAYCLTRGSSYYQATRTLGLSDSRTLGLSDSRTLGLSDSRTLGLSDSRTRTTLPFRRPTLPLFKFSLKYE